MDLASILHTASIVALPILVAITFHEAAHGFVADRKGDPTAKYLGRLTLNPFAHIDPLGTILLPMVMLWVSGAALGYAKPVPVNFMNLRKPKSDMVWVAAAGPLTNFALAVLSGLALRGLVGVGWVSEADILRAMVGMGGGSSADLGGPLSGGAHHFSVLEPILQMLLYSVLINVSLMLFNLLPVPPLDGGRVLVGMLPNPASNQVARLEPYGMLIIMALVFLDPFHLVWRILSPISSTLVRLIL